MTEQSKVARAALDAAVKAFNEHLQRERHAHGVDTRSATYKRLDAAVVDARASYLRTLTA